MKILGFQMDSEDHEESDYNLNLDSPTILY